MKTTYLYVFNLVAESYFLALCESDRKEQISDVFKNTDILKIASFIFIPNIFKSLGRLQLKSEAEKLLFRFYYGTIIMLLCF
jgi:hypothetical protein